MISALASPDDEELELEELEDDDEALEELEELDELEELLEELELEELEELELSSDPQAVSRDAAEITPMIPSLASI